MGNFIQIATDTQELMNTGGPALTLIIVMTAIYTAFTCVVISKIYGRHMAKKKKAETVERVV